MAKKAFESNFKNVSRRIKATAEKRVFAMANEHRNELVKTLSGGRSGHVYRIPGTGKTYTASAPGESPASPTGRLRTSFQITTRRTRQGPEARIGSRLPYALELERGNSRVRPRPYFVKSFKKARPKMLKIIERKWF